MKKITVLGSGTMGNGIAHVFAMNGHSVNLYDLDGSLLTKALERITKNLERQIKKDTIPEAQKVATLENIRLQTDLAQAAGEADLIVEAIPEKRSLKADLFRQLDRLAPDKAIFASNTSSISITSLATYTNRPGKVIGMHFMNPVPLMKLVEVVRGYNTSGETVNFILDIARKLGKEPVVVNDYPGFIANRILMPMINEAIYALYQRVSGVNEIDTVMKLGMAHPMGPLQLADFIGLDVCLSILKVMQEGFGEAKYAPCPLLVNMVEAGHLGMKTGEGFYRWSKESKDRMVSERFIN